MQWLGLSNLSWKEAFSTYKTKTPWNLRVLDTYQIVLVLLGLFQALASMLVGISSQDFLYAAVGITGSFILAGSHSLTLGCLKMQLNPTNGFKITPKQAFAEFLFANFVLQLGLALP